MCNTCILRVKTIQDKEVDFTDRHYQDGLPMVARSTATKAVKSNITLSEILAEPDINVNKQKVQAVINFHLQQRQLERIADPSEWRKGPGLIILLVVNKEIVLLKKQSFENYGEKKTIKSVYFLVFYYLAIFTGS